MRIWLLTLAAAALVPLAAGCGSGDGPPAQGDTATATTEGSAVLAALPQGADPVTLRPADFVRSIDNPYWPMAPGSRWVYSETDAEGNEQRVEVTVTHETKTIVGIEATVVHDVVSENGQVVEDTYDWYAQDTAGNIWYLGEDTL